MNTTINLCPTCAQDMSDPPRSGAVDCPQCGQGIHNKDITSIEKAESLTGAAPRFVVISDPGYYGFFTFEGAKAFLSGELDGKGQIKEIKLNEES
jgi:hypothetical protein